MSKQQNVQQRNEDLERLVRAGTTYSEPVIEEIAREGFAVIELAHCE